MTLYIIGNGFDLKHGIPSRYSDFAKFVNNTDLSFFQRMERFYPNLSNGDLWNNFENALGMPDYKEIAKDYKISKQKSDTERDDFIGVRKDILAEKMGKWLYALTELITSHNYEKKYILDKNSYFLTFNYTPTLECIYKINGKKICHIHDRVHYEEDHDHDRVHYEEESSKYYTGYNWGHGRTSSEPDIEMILQQEVSENYDKIKEVINDFAKEYKTSDCESFLNKIKSTNTIDTIICLGHSLASVDYPYFNKIKETFPNAIWKIGYYDEADMINKLYYCSEIELNNKQFFQDH